MTKLLTWKCPECDRVIESIYKAQFEHNKEAHIKSHSHQKPMVRRKPRPIKELKEEFK